jgi:hypothetical protein
MTTDQAVQKVREFIRLKHFSLSTEDSYCLYVRQFCEHSQRLPKSLSTEKRIESYLSISPLDAILKPSPIPRRLPLSQPSAFFVLNQNETALSVSQTQKNAVAPQGAAAGGR